MDVAAARDSGEIVEAVELFESSESLQHAEVEGRATNAAAREADSVQFFFMRQFVDVGWFACSRRPEAPGHHLLLEEPLAGGVLHDGGQAGLRSGVAAQQARDRVIVGRSEIHRRRWITEGFAKGVGERFFTCDIPGLPEFDGSRDDAMGKLLAVGYGGRGDIRVGAGLGDGDLLNRLSASSASQLPESTVTAWI